MSSIDSIRPTTDGAWGVSVDGSDLVRYPPEPRNTTGAWLKTAVGAVTNVAESFLAPGSFAASGNFQSLLNTQIEVQKVMQTYSMLSNIEKSKHETEMAPIRNMRVG